MFLTKNHNTVIKKLASRSFHKHGMRNIVAVLAIALTTFLFASVLTIGLGTKNAIEYSQRRLQGSQADALLQNMTKEQFEEIKAHSMFEQVGCWIPVEIMTNTNRLTVEIDYADKEQQAIRFLTPNTGSAPEQENEVLVSSNVLKDMGIKEEIGEELPLEFTCGEKKYQFHMKITGIYEAVQNDMGYVIVSEEFFKAYPEVMESLTREGKNIYSADVVAKDTGMLEERISQLVYSLGGNTEDSTADNYVRVAVSPQFSNDNNLMITLAAGVFIVLFVFCGYLLIYNVFEIAVTNEIRQFGLLRTVGTTAGQVKYLMNYQALYLFLIGTIIGIFPGILAGRVIMPMTIKVFAIDYAGDELIVGDIPYLAIVVGVILFSGFTVFVSTRKPVKKASKVSPVEAVRYVEPATIDIKKRRSKTGSVIPRMARANMQRSKRRITLIVTSLILSIVLLNCVFIYAGSFDVETYIQKETRSDFVVYNRDLGLAFKGFNGHKSGLDAQVLQKIEEQPGIYNKIKMYRNTYDDIQIACDWGKKYPVDNTYKESFQLPENMDLGVYVDNEGDYHYAALTPDEHLPMGNVFGVSEALVDKIDILEGEKEPSVLKKKLEEGKGVILMTQYNDKGNVSQAGFEGVNVGECIRFYENGTLVQAFDVIAKAVATPGETTITSGGVNLAGNVGGPWIFMSEESFKALYEIPTLYSFLFDVEEENKGNVESYLENYVLQNDKVLYTSSESLEKSVMSIKNIILLVGGLIGAIFALVGLINFTNLIITSVISRRHEFATMQSVGMTKQQLQKMIITESIFYVLRAGIVGIPLALMLGLTLIKFLVEKGPLFHMMKFHMTLMPAVTLAFGFIIVAFLIPVIVLQIFQRHSTAEQLRLGE